MDNFQLDDILSMEANPYRSTRSKPVKRKWREIEAIQDRRQLQKELMELDYFGEYKLEDLDI
ncbi:MAG: DUF3545 family protein [Vibrio sp.]